LFSRFSSRDFKISGFSCKHRLHLGLPLVYGTAFLRMDQESIIYIYVRKRIFGQTFFDVIL
jgi:hypothetical protein